MRNKLFIAAVTISLVISFLAGTIFVEVAKANPYWGVYPVAPNQDKPILVVESPTNYSTIIEGNITLNFTVIKPSSWNMSVAPFGTCANGRIDSVNVSLNGLQEFQEFLYFDNLNGGGSWNKSYSLNLGELHLGLNAVQVIASALALSSSGNYPMNVTSTLYLNYSEISPTPTISPIITPSPSTTQQPTSTPPWVLPLIESELIREIMLRNIIIAVVAIIAIISVVLLVYFKNIKK
jgi:hypothetical protein